MPVRRAKIASFLVTVRMAVVSAPLPIGAVISLKRNEIVVDLVAGLRQVRLASATATDFSGSQPITRPATDP